MPHKELPYIQSSLKVQHEANFGRKPSSNFFNKRNQSVKSNQSGQPVSSEDCYLQNIYYPQVVSQPKGIGKAASVTEKRKRMLLQKQLCRS